MTLPPLPSRYVINAFVTNARGKTDKFPIDPISKKKINAHDPNSWMSYETAVGHLITLGDGYSLGFSFIPDDKYFFIDLDNCLLANGQWSPVATAICMQFSGCYIEVSQSGRGLHIIGKYDGYTPAHSCKNIPLGLELYTSGRFCAITQMQAVGDCGFIATSQLKQFITDYSFDRAETGETDEEWTTECEPGHNVPDDNNEILRIIRNMPKSANEVFEGKKYPNFDDLFENNEEELAKFYPSSKSDVYDRSSADGALAYRLLYFVGRNCERVCEIMQMSKLVREKWTRSDYLPRTIISARSKQNKCFDHHSRDRNDPIVASSGQQNLRILQKNHYPELDDKFMKPIDTAVNLKFLLDGLGITVRWNEMARCREIKFPDYIPYHEDEENLALYRVKDIAAKNYFPITRVDEHLDTIAEENPFHPIVEGLKQNPWDGVPRLTKFIQSVKTENPELSYKLMFRWMLSAVAAAHSPNGFAAQGVLVLAGKQYIGKTRFLKSLDCFGCRAVKEGAILDPTNKDNIMTLAAHWIIELGELDGTFRRADIARLKSHLTSDVDILRKPFGRKDSRFARRTVYAASVNDPKFLVDNTGNRRWWTVPVLEINFNHGLDIMQVWAEVYAILQMGEQTWLTDSEFRELNALNEEHEIIEPFEEKLLHFYDFKHGWERRETERKSATIILNTIGYQNVSRADATRMGAIITKFTGKKTVNRLHTVPKFKVPDNSDQH